MSFLFVYFYLHEVFNIHDKVGVLDFKILSIHSKRGLLTPTTRHRSKELCFFKLLIVFIVIKLLMFSPFFKLQNIEVSYYTLIIAKQYNIINLRQICQIHAVVLAIIQF